MGWGWTADRGPGRGPRQEGPGEAKPLDLHSSVPLFGTFAPRALRRPPARRVSLRHSRVPLQARRAMEEEEIPVGCVLARHGEVVSRGANRTNATRNGTRHCEFEAIDALLRANGGDVEACAFPTCTLYVTCEPCIMCAGALSLVGVGRVVFGCPNDKFGGNGSIWRVHEAPCGTCGVDKAGSRGRRGGAMGKGSEGGGDEGGGGRGDERPQGAAEEDGGRPQGTAEGDGGGRRPAALCAPAAYPSLGGLRAVEAVKLLQTFYAAGNPRAPVPHRPVVPRERSGKVLQTGADVVREDS